MTARVVLSEGGTELRDFLSSVSPKGQITIPIEIRRELGVKPKDKVRMRLEDGAVIVRPTSFTLSEVFGSVQPATPADAFKAMEQSAREEQSERQVRRLQER